MDTPTSKKTDAPGESPVRRFMMTLAYDGTNFNGWQIQPGDPSIQEQIQKALAIALRRPVSITGAGRTDTGVHARTMTAHFDTDHPAPDTPAVLKTLNAILRPDITIHSIVPVHDEAHARFDAEWRTYRYFVNTVPDPFRQGHSLYVPRPLDFEAMNREAADLLGTKDFTSFSKLHTDTKTNICTVTHAAWHQTAPGQWYFEITANRFLRNMVRAIVGTLLHIGSHPTEPGHIARVLAALDRGAAGSSASAKGLFLWDITYPYPIIPSPLPDHI